ncbi:MAG TPA: hypothetical protein VFG23_19275 [Polyangia bacterium]|nr:hypothetical protein [Polyangia bacterium]
MLRNTALLLAAGLLGAGCSGSGEPHGSPILIQAFWVASGQRFLIWTLDADPTLAKTVPAAGQEIDFVFDRRLDGSRIEDTTTVNGMQTEVPKAMPPITVGWDGLAPGTFGDQVLYNSEPLFGSSTAFVLLQPLQIGFPAAETVTFSLDKTGLTSAYGDQMTGPAQIPVTTGPFSASFGLPAPVDGSISVPADYLVPIQFSNRPASTDLLAPYVQVTAGGQDLSVSLAPNPSDPTIVYLSPVDCLGGWPAGGPVEITLLAGLPDAFGVGLAATTNTSFEAPAGAAQPDGGCGVLDAGQAGDAGTDTASPDAGRDAGANPDGHATPDGARTDARAG